MAEKTSNIRFVVILSPEITPPNVRPPMRYDHVINAVRRHEGNELSSLKEQE